MENKKIILIVAIIVVIIASAIFLINRNKSNKNIDIEVPKEIPYEYFVMYSKDDKAGVIDKSGNIVIEPKYSEIYIPNQSKDVFFCFNESEDKEEYAILNKEGKEILTDFEEVIYLETSEPSELILEKEVLRYKKDNLYGLINFEGEVITEPIYERITSLTNKPGEILVRQDGKYGILTSKGEVKIPIKYDSITGDEYCDEKYGYGLTGYVVSIKIDTGVMYGYLDYNGNEILKPQYETITRVLEYQDKEDIYIVARNNGKKGVFKNGKQIIDFNYQSINYADSSNVFIVERTGKYGFYTNKGEEILPAKYTSYGMAGDYISVVENDNHMLYDLNGNLINKDKYLSMIEVENSSYFIAMDEEGLYSIISKDFETTEKYTYISYAFDDNFVFINEEGFSGVLNVWKGTVIEPKYTSVLNVQGAKMIEARNEETGEVDLYNSKLEKVCTINGAIVEKITENEKDFVVAYSETEMMYFDKEGKEVKNTEVYPDHKLFAIQKDGKWGFADKDGKIVLECNYDIVTELNEYGFAGIKKDGKWGVINSNGEIILEPTYEIDEEHEEKLSFIGKYYGIEYSSGEIYYTDEIIKNNTEEQSIEEIEEQTETENETE